MKAEDKINRIKEISMSEFELLIRTLLGCLKFENVRLGDFDNILLADEAGTLVKQGYMIVLLSELLSGDKVAGRSMIEDAIVSRLKQFPNERIIISSTHNISEGFKKSVDEQFVKTQIIYWGCNELVVQIDEKNADYWYSSDKFLSQYEKEFLQNQSKEFELSKLNIFGEKHQQMLSVFVNPKILKLKFSNKREAEFVSTATIQQIALSNSPSILTGEPGTGKTTILRKIGEQLIDWNHENLNAKKYLPIFLDYVEILNHDHSIQKVVESKVSKVFVTQKLEDVIKGYKIVLLIDSLDEFSTDVKGNLMHQIDRLRRKEVNYIITSRSLHASFDFSNKSKLETYIVEKFDFQRARLFLRSVFKNDDSKINNLIESLEENRILDKMPITPLTLSLISILYEEKKYEIPATITDIFDLFNSFLLGKLNISSRLEFLDISIRERILSLYAFEMMNRKEHSPMTLEEFNAFFRAFFKARGIDVEQDVLEDALMFLIENTGILQIQRGRTVEFSNDSFMEYYAAIEIFHHQRSKEDLLVENFLIPSWQNASIFYAGKSKDMPGFLENVLKISQLASNLPEFMSGVMGIGYLLQALYLTNNDIRIQGIDVALKLNLKLYDAFKVLANNEIFLFKSLNLVSLSAIPILLFRQNFNSITIKAPLRSIFSSRLSNFDEKHVDAVSQGFEMVQLAITLATERINDIEPIERLIEHPYFAKNGLFVQLLELGIEMLHGEGIREVRKELGKQSSRLKEVISGYGKPVSKAIFGPTDQIHSVKKVILVVEGKFDADHLHHAFDVLTKKTPYWRFLPSTIAAGGANEVTKALVNGKTTLDEDQILIGIYDHDTKGWAEWNGGLPADQFEVSEYSSNIKKHRSANIFGICIPIPESDKIYQQDRQNFKFFELEHYYPIEFLRDINALEPVPISGELYEIKNKAKAKIADQIKLKNDVEFFKEFEPLFRLIDHASGVDGKIIYL